MLTIIIGNQKVTVRALVLDINADVLLGTDALHHLGAKISIGGAEFLIDLPNIPMVEAMLLATKPIRVNPTVTELHYKLIPSCDACERHAPSVTINVYGENTNNYAIASKYNPALNTAQTTNTPLDPDPCVCNEASSATERLPPSSPKTITTDTAKTINKRQATKAKATKNRDPTIKNGWQLEKWPIIPGLTITVRQSHRETPRDLSSFYADTGGIYRLRKKFIRLWGYPVKTPNKKKKSSRKSSNVDHSK